MNKSPLTKVLLGIATVLALWSLMLCYMHINRVRQLRALQVEANRLGGKQQVLTLLLNDAVEYSKTHPAMEPILQAIRTRAGVAATSAIPSTVKPGAK